MSDERREGRRSDVCFWCDGEVYDVGDLSGYTGDGPDWASWIGHGIDGFDWGCDSHPISDPELGSGPHETLAMVREIVRQHHGDET